MGSCLGKSTSKVTHPDLLLCDSHFSMFLKDLTYFASVGLPRP